MVGHARPRTMLAGAFAAALAAAPLAASAQTIQGILLERGTERPIDLGEVVLVRVEGDTVAVALSDENGVFQLRAPEPGEYRVIGRALGYLGRGDGPFELEEGAVVVVQLRLDFAPIPIEGVGVETTRIVISDDALLANGFYERMMRGRGQFLTPEDVEASDAKFTPLLFRQLDYVHKQYGAAPWQTWVQLWNPMGPGGCPPRVYVDDVWINRSGWELYAEGLGLADAVPIETIKAVEVYWAMQAPTKYSAPDAFGGAGLCGALVIWTKAGS